MLYGSQNTTLFTVCYFNHKLVHNQRYYLQVISISRALNPLIQGGKSISEA
jgi:hypothetical protein